MNICKPPKQNPKSLSFTVFATTDYHDGGVLVSNTTLKMFTSEDTVTIRGKPWPVGTKLDFKLVKAELPK